VSQTTRRKVLSVRIGTVALEDDVNGQPFLGGPVVKLADSRRQQQRDPSIWRQGARWLT
jgi:hypothetical protein